MKFIWVDDIVPYLVVLGVGAMRSVRGVRKRSAGRGRRRRRARAAPRADPCADLVRAAAARLHAHQLRDVFTLYQILLIIKVVNINSL